MKPQKHLLGEQGERIAAAFLQKENCTIIARNYRFGKSEIDIIAQDGSALVFIEVKSFHSEPLGAAEFRVNKKKQQMIIRGANGYLNEHPEFEGRDIRFDVMIIDFSAYPANITHHKAAFWLEEPF